MALELGDFHVEVEVQTGSHLENLKKRWNLILGPGTGGGGEAKGGAAVWGKGDR